MRVDLLTVDQAGACWRPMKEGRRLVSSMLGILGALATAAQAERPLRFAGNDGNPIATSIPGFDCGRVRSFAERTICAQRPLGFEDRAIGETYTRLIQHLSATEGLQLRKEQRAWLHKRDACADAQCLSDMLDQRGDLLSKRLERRDAFLRASLRRPGDC